MVVSCCAVNCKARYVKGSGVSFFRFPSNTKQREAWIKAVSRAKWSPSVHDRLCENHFVGKKPSVDPTNVDYFPTIFADQKGIRFTPVKRGGDRLERLEKRKQRRLSVDTESTVDTETMIDSADDGIFTDISSAGEQEIEQRCLQDVGKYSTHIYSCYCYTLKSNSGLFRGVLALARSFDFTWLLTLFAYPGSKFYLHLQN